MSIVLPPLADADKLPDNEHGRVLHKHLEAGRLDLRAAVERITDFPDEMEDEPDFNQLLPGRFPVVEVILWGPEPELSQTAEDLEHRLERLDLIGDVTAVGLNDPEVRVLIDPVLAREHGVTPPGVDNPEWYRVRTTSATLPKGDDWLDTKSG